MLQTTNITARECMLPTLVSHFYLLSCLPTPLSLFLSLSHSLLLNRKRLARFEQFRNLRERTMVHELGQTFFITQTSDAFAICNIILPNADQHDRKILLFSQYFLTLHSCSHFISEASIHDQLAVGLGYVAQLVHHLAAALSVPLQYPLLLNGSKSSIFDHISDISAVQTNREYV